MRHLFRGLVWSAALGVLLSVVACDLLPYRWDRGERIYRKECAQCHGTYGDGEAIRGMSNSWTNLVDDDFRYGGDVTAMENVIRDGVVGQMPAYDRDEISREDMRALINYLFELRGDQPPFSDPPS